jgi:proteasome lid subunit RPN8/RPN11
MTSGEVRQESDQPRLTMAIHADAARLLRTLAASDLEIAGVLSVSVSETPGEIRFLVRDFEEVAGYELQTATELRITPSAYMPAVTRAANAGASAFFVHSHPGADPDQSPKDDRVDELIRSVFQIRTNTDFYGSLVVRLENGNLSFTGRAWRGEAFLGAVVLLREFGDRFWFTSSVDAPAPLPVPVVFDRQVLAFGDGVQQLLASLHVGIVGGGGTGSPLCEQLIRAGIGELTVVDYQQLEDTNVTRVYGSSLNQVGDDKVKVVDDNAERIGLGTIVHPIKSKVDRAALEKLQACDVIFNCTDDHTGRFDVSKLAYWCLIPVFDLGAQFDPVDSAQQGIYCRVDLFMPGLPCPLCTGQVDPAQLRAEGLPPEERTELEREGYLRGQHNADPAVIAFTTMSAALAFSELLLRLTGLNASSPSRLLFYIRDRRLATSTWPLADHWCSEPRTWGAIRNTDGRYLGAILA